MNGGKFDGGLLSLEQKQLRQFYADLLSLAVKNPALTQGGYIDLTEHNIAKGYIDDKVHAFIRFHEGEKLLIVTTYSDKSQDIRIQIPEEAARTIGLDPNESYIARDLLWREAEVGFDNTQTFALTVKPYSSYIFTMK
jgi:hypothetical protein